jgi:predicted DNA-binding transcriptional regulator YafY
MTCRLNKSQKFVRVLSEMQQPNGVKADDLVERYDLDDRTLRRYLSDLRAIDVPIQDDGRGIDRVLSLDPAYGRKGVQLTLLEMVSLRFGRTLFDFLEGTGFAEDMDDALERISTWSGANGIQGAMVQHLDRKFIAIPEHAKDHTGDAEVLDEILTALLRQNPAEAMYARVGGQLRSYSLQPLTLANWRHSLYLFAKDLGADMVKTFAVDRFRVFKRTRGVQFVYPEDFDPKAIVRDCFGIIGGPVTEIRLRFSRAVAPYVQERVWHASQVVTPVVGGEVEVTMRVGLSPELETWILGFGPQVHVIDPDTLGTRIRQLHLEAARQ